MKKVRDEAVQPKMIDRNKRRILWITRTAAFLALLVVMQAATAPMGNTIVTGSIVNLLLILSVLTGGLLSGMTVAAVSPVAARMFGIGPHWGLIPFIMLGNIVLVLLWHWIDNREVVHALVTRIIALITAAIAKFLVLYLSIVQIAIPFLLGLPDQQAAVLAGTFSIPQLVTASIGGALAILILPVIQRATR